MGVWIEYVTRRKEAEEGGKRWQHVPWLPVEIGWTIPDRKRARLHGRWSDRIDENCNGLAAAKRSNFAREQRHAAYTTTLRPDSRYSQSKYVRPSRRRSYTRFSNMAIDTRNAHGTNLVPL